MFADRINQSLQDLLMPRLEKLMKSSVNSAETSLSVCSSDLNVQQEQEAAHRVHVPTWTGFIAMATELGCDSQHRTVLGLTQT